MEKYGSKVKKNNGTTYKICWCGSGCNMGCKVGCVQTCKTGCAFGYKGSVSSILTNK